MPTSPVQQLRDSYRRVTDAMARAAVKSGRRAEDVLMVAVTKTATPDQIRQLFELGHVDFGENRVQQLVQRAGQLEEYRARKKLLGSDEATAGRSDEGFQIKPKSQLVPRWHMIGHLQRNKLKQVLPVVRLVHSVDTLRLAEELHAWGLKHDRLVEVLLQINISGEESKSGVAPPAALHVAEQIDSMINLRLRGVMTMAPYSDNPEDARPYFARCAELFLEIQRAKFGGEACNILSMGMSGDFEVAIEEGANVVRIGRALFGDNPDEASPTELPDRPVGGEEE